MPLVKKENDASGEKSSFGKKLKGVFSSKGESRSRTPSPLPPQYRPVAPAPTPYFAGPQYASQGLLSEQGYARFGQAPSTQSGYPPPPPPPGAAFYGSPGFPQRFPSPVASDASRATYSLPPPHLRPAASQNNHPKPVYVRPESALSSQSFQRQKNYDEADEELFIHDRQGYSPPRRPHEASRSRTPSPDGPHILIVSLPEDPDAEDGGEPRLMFLVPTNRAGLLSTGAPQTRPDFRVATPSILPAEQEREQPFYINTDSESSDESLASLPTIPTIPTKGRSPARYSLALSRSKGYVDGADFKVDKEQRTDADDEGGPNLNRRYHFLPESMVPFWYIKNPAVALKGSRNYLCATCRHINILELFKQEESSELPKQQDYITIGTFWKMAGSQDCGLCQLASRIIASDTGVKLPKGLSEEERKNKQKEKLNELMAEGIIFYICPIRFQTTFSEPVLYICSDKEVNEASKMTKAQRPRGSMGFRPISKAEPNLGRLLMTPDVIDFEWIRNLMERCDERDIGRLIYFHSIKVRAIDVHRMCLVDLDDGARYVTLSYVWGGVCQFLLTENTEAIYRRNGSLLTAWDRIPKTIQDSIELVREIGEQYLWVDAMCILQDNLEDKKEQIGSMGKIYGNSILTICICCGEDANYGIPGIRPGTRTTRQVAVVVGNLVLGNDVHDSEDLEHMKWDTRGWTLQEKVLSQRKLQIYDNCVRWWCWHTITSEDEHCRHVCWKPGTRHQYMYFFKTEHDLVVSKIDKNSNMDIYAFMISDYTARDLTHQSDAENAVKGVLGAIDSLFQGSFIAGLPDTELSAALLWVPLGPSKRRKNLETGQPMFPSWSWLGWQGHVAYPWLIERSIPMSEYGSPLVWESSLPYQNSNTVQIDDDDVRWFTGNEYRTFKLVNSQTLEHRPLQKSNWSIDEFDGWSYIDHVGNPGHRWLHPIEQHTDRAFDFFHKSPNPSINQLRLRTLSARFMLDSSFRLRKEKHDYQHSIYQVRILNEGGFAAGYIYTPNPETLLWYEQRQFVGDGDNAENRSWTREFIVLSRASTFSDPRIGDELLRETPTSRLHSVYSMAHIIDALGRMGVADRDELVGEQDQHIDAVGHFDTRLYDPTLPWGLFNVMMIERDQDQSPGGGQGCVARRIAFGRIHVAAFMAAEPKWTQLALE
jgi:hypothetical protein